MHPAQTAREYPARAHAHAGVKRPLVQQPLQAHRRLVPLRAIEEGLRQAVLLQRLVEPCREVDAEAALHRTRELEGIGELRLRTGVDEHLAHARDRRGTSALLDV